MKSLALYAVMANLGAAITDFPMPHAMQKRDEDDTFRGFSCYNISISSFDGFSALCPNINYPIEDLGRSVMETLYFALASTQLPDDTTYTAQENIVCIVPGNTQKINATIDAGISNNVASAGASVSFTLTMPNFGGSSICMFTKGTSSNNNTGVDIITLGRARELLYTMITFPGVDCKTCAKIPIRYPNVTDGTDQGGILKINRIDTNNCIGKCVGPNSFQVSASPSASAGLRTQPLCSSFGVTVFAFLSMAWLCGMSIILVPIMSF